MIEIAFRTAPLPTADRLPMFDQCQLDSPHPMRALSAEPERFFAEVRERDLGGGDLVELTCSTIDVVRSSMLVRRVDPEFYSIIVPRRGRVTLSQAGRVASLTEGSMGLYTSSA